MLCKFIAFCCVTKFFKIQWLQSTEINAHCCEAGIEHGFCEVLGESQELHLCFTARLGSLFSSDAVCRTVVLFYLLKCILLSSQRRDCIEKSMTKDRDQTIRSKVRFYTHILSLRLTWRLTILPSGLCLFDISRDG